MYPQIRRNGRLVSENEYRSRIAQKEHRKHVRDVLAQAIVHKALDMERQRQVAIRKKLEEIAKLDLVARVRVRKLFLYIYLYIFWLVV